MAKPAKKPRAIFSPGSSNSKAFTLPHYCPIGEKITFATDGIQGSIILADMRGDITSKELAIMLEEIEPVIKSWYLLKKRGDGDQ